ncbi:inner membrane-spanning protein YciB [Parvibaculum lavamentivorans]|uniref:inner membrane-spanning protein YciB n=1 Tax=Parvibaculum lavamentivorans TaxID=256618 RepID=UPI0000ED46AC|nr:inner membrane-spanning protein YciB [Parvibaculum lavamentivorans]
MQHAASPIAPSLSSVAVPFLRRTVIELGPALIFFAAFSWQGIMVGTGAFMAAALISVAVTYAERRTFPITPIVTAFLVLCFGGLTLLFHESTYVKMQPTAANALYAAVLSGALLSGHNLLKRTFSPELHLDDAGWEKLTWRIVGYLVALALTNEFVRIEFSTETWIAFKTFVLAGLNFAFLLLQFPLLRAHWRPAPFVAVPRS